MATSSRLSLFEYLKTSYPPDREYVDGELLDRNVGKLEHARLQALLASGVTYPGNLLVAIVS